MIPKILSEESLNAVYYFMVALLEDFLKSNNSSPNMTQNRSWLIKEPETIWSDSKVVLLEPSFNVLYLKEQKSSLNSHCVSEP